MADSRINVNLIDQSGFVRGGVIVVRGGSVIRSSKGTEVPQWFDAGSETEILRRLGYPSVDYPDVYEVIEFNKSYGLWVSAPNKDGKNGGMLVTTTGTVALSDGLTDPTTFDFSTVSIIESVGTGNGILTNFTATLPHTYVDTTIDTLSIGGAEEAISASDVEPEVLTAPSLASGTLTRATNALDITFTIAPVEGADITVRYDADFTLTAYFVLFSKSPHAQTEKTLITYDTDSGFFSIAYYITDNRGKDVLVNTYIVSQIPDTVDGFKNNIYVDTYFEDNLYLSAQSNDLVYSAFTDDTTRTALGAGTRGTTPTTTELTAGWTYFQSVSTYPTNIFMDFSADSAIPAIFNTLRSTYKENEIADFIMPLPDSEDKTAAIATKAGYSINNRGLGFYWNWKKVKEKYNSTQFYTSQIGSVGVKWGQMADIYNGMAPAMVDENGRGGQITGAVIELRYDPTQLDVNDLADAGINAIKFDPDYGIIITHQRTGQTPSTLSDTSFIGHSRMIDYCISNIVRQVLVAQLIKLNDVTHQTMVRAKTEAILNPILGAGLLREFIVKCDNDNNTDEIKAQRKFLLAVSIKVTPFSEEIQLDFILSPQGVAVEDTLG